MPKQGRNAGQVRADGQEALVAATHVALGAGWGDSTKTVGTGTNDVAGQVVVTAVTGGGLAQATATIVITFASAYKVAPRVCIATVTSTSSIDEGHVTWSCTTTALTLTFSVLPVNTKVYTFNYLLVA